MSDTALAFLLRTIDEVAEQGQQIPLWIALPAPHCDPLRLWPANGDAYYWRDGDGLSALGWGEGHCVEMLSHQELRRVTQTARPWYQQLKAICHPQCSDALPQWFWGMSFHAQHHRLHPWHAFPAFHAAMPQWTYVQRKTDSLLALCIAAKQNKVALKQQAQCLWERLETLAQQSKVTPRCDAELSSPWVSLADDDASARAWQKDVDAVIGQINEGALHKLVLARCHQTRIDATRSIPEILSTLQARFAQCAIFAFRLGTQCLLGATPEVLMRKDGEDIYSEALAGSAVPEEAHKLVARDKEQGEHRFVVEAIAQALQERCSALTVATTPQLRHLPNIVHLHTPLHGVLRDPSTSLIELCLDLHPTPAVGGLPRQRAIDWIEAQESLSRGWYGAPLGCMDAQGDGTAAVVLRAALLEHRDAWVYAGAGIVAQSDAAQEYNETLIKMQAMLQALKPLQQ